MPQVQEKEKEKEIKEDIVVISDFPPKRPPESKKARARSWPQEKSVATALKAYFDSLGLMVGMVNEADGKIIAEGSDKVVEELINLARVDIKIRKLLIKLAAPGKYGPLLLAVSPILIGVAANHNLLPQFRFTVKPKMEEIKS